MIKTNQITIASIKIQTFDSNNFTIRNINRSKNSCTCTKSNFFKKLIIIRVYGITPLTIPGPPHVLKPPGKPPISPRKTTSEYQKLKILVIISKKTKNLRCFSLLYSLHTITTTYFFLLEIFFFFNF